VCRLWKKKHTCQGDNKKSEKKFIVAGEKGENYCNGKGKEKNLVNLGKTAVGAPWGKEKKRGKRHLQDSPANNRKKQRIRGPVTHWGRGKKNVIHEKHPFCQVTTNFSNPWLRGQQTMESNEGRGPGCSQT